MSHEGFYIGSLGRTTCFLRHEHRYLRLLVHTARIFFGALKHVAVGRSDLKPLFAMRSGLVVEPAQKLTESY